MCFRTQCAHDDTHHDRAASYTQSYGNRHARDGHRNGAQGQTQDDAQEYAAHVGLVQRLYGVAYKFLNIVKRFRRTHHHDVVSVLESQTVCSQQFHVAAQYTAHIHPIGGSQLQLAQMFAVEHPACQYHAPAGHLVVYVVPVYFSHVPVSSHLLSEEQLQRVVLLLGGDDQHLVAYLQSRVGHRHDDLCAAPYTRDDEVLVRGAGKIADLLPIEGRVHNFVFADIGLVGISLLRHLQIAGSGHKSSQQNHGHDHAHHTYRISHGGTQCQRACRNARML